MMQILVAASAWLHSLATIVFIGFYLLLALIFLPILGNEEMLKTTGAALSGISKRSRVWIYISMLVFIVTGVYLTFVDSNYRGIGNFSNPWAILMLIKHILILGMLGMGFWFNAILRVGPLMSSNTGASQALSRFRWYVNAMAIIGVVVLFLTALSQAQ
ncbi:MAG: hypothetical protein M1282_01525 [Chloroflexi bacterium]|nr:hypothetical protein [Chloroflexota bacterium]